jgi:hypothetical protein
MSDEVTTQERLLKLLFRITKFNAWMPITEIIDSVTQLEDHPNDEELEKRLLEKYGSYIHEK